MPLARVACVAVHGSPYGSLRTMLWAVSQAVGIRPDVDPPAPRHGIRSVLSIPGLGGRGTGRLRPQATSISTAHTIRKFILRAPLEPCPWLPRPSTEPTHRAGHALHRARHRRAHHARTTRCSMAAAPSPLPRRTERCLFDAARYTTRVPCTGLHLGGTHGMPLSAANMCAMHGKQLHVPWSCIGEKRVRERRAQVEQRGCRARTWPARPWAAWP